MQNTPSVGTDYINIGTMLQQVGEGLYGLWVVFGGVVKGGPLLDCFGVDVDSMFDHQLNGLEHVSACSGIFALKDAPGERMEDCALFVGLGMNGDAVVDEVLDAVVGLGVVSGKGVHDTPAMDTDRFNVSTEGDQELHSLQAAGAIRMSEGMQDRKALVSSMVDVCSMLDEQLDSVECFRLFLDEDVEGGGAIGSQCHRVVPFVKKDVDHIPKDGGIFLDDILAGKMEIGLVLAEGFVALQLSWSCIEGVFGRDGVDLSIGLAIGFCGSGGHEREGMCRVVVVLFVVS